MMEPVKVAAIGYGYWGPNLIRNFVELPSSEVVGVADLDERRRRHVRERHPQISVITPDYHELLELDLDAVVVATPPHSHFEIVRKCLNQGLHVLVEKPIALTSNESLQLIKLAEAQNRVLMVGHTMVYHPAIRALRHMIANGELGRIYYIDAVRVSLGLFQTKLNVMWDLAPHDISILLYLLDAEPTHVSAQGMACVHEGIEDIVYVHMQFPDNVLAHIRNSWLDPRKTRRITVVGSEKMAVFDDLENQEKLTLYDKRVDAIRHTDTFGESQFAYHYGDVVSPYVRMEEPLRMECQHFLDCIREGRRPDTDGHNGLKVVEVLEAAQRSLNDSGGPRLVANGDRMLEAYPASYMPR